MAVVIGKGLRIGTASVSVGVGQGLRVGPVIGEAPAALSIFGTPASAIVGDSGTFVPSISGGTAPYTLSLLSGTLPPGRTVNGAAKTVTGAYTTAGSYSYVLRATDSVGATAELPVTLTVNAASGLAAYAPEAETTTALARRGTAPSYKQNYHFNRMMKALKASSGWAKVTALWVTADIDPALALVNLKSPGTYDLLAVGTPTHTPRVGVSTTINTSYYNTQIPLNSLSRDSTTAMLWTETADASTTSDFGAIDGASAGISLSCGSGSAAARNNGSNVSSISTGAVDGRGCYGTSRNSSTGFDFDHNGVNKQSPTNASAAITSTIPIFLLKVNGSTSPSPRTIRAAMIGTGMTLMERRQIYAAVQTYVDALKHGLINVQDAGVGDTNLQFDCVAYGATFSSIQYAYEAKRRGKSVAIIGGWRERHIGGMSTSGLAFVDFFNKTGIGGLSRAMIDRAKVICGTSGTADVYFTPKSMLQVCREMLDPSSVGGLPGFDIPIFWTTGIGASENAGNRLRSITTRDGRKISFRYSHDGCYEGDLLPAANIATIIGREAAGAGTEATNGWRGYSTALGSSEHQYAKDGVYHNVDPFVTPGTPASGLLPGLISPPAKTLGQADDEVQSYNFRVTMSATPIRRGPLPSTAPAGYSALKYEALGRWFAVATGLSTPLTLGDILYLSGIPQNLVDVNSNGGMGSDRWGSGTAYSKAANNAAREAVWQDVAQWYKGLWYYLQYEADSRIPSAVRTTALTYGYANDHYLDPENGDEIFFPPQLYVRGLRRMVGLLVWNGNDLAGADGTTPRSIKTAGMASYPVDDHHTQAIADTANVPPRIWNEGNFFSSAGGVDQLAPVPYEITVPVKAQCENVSTSFSVSSTCSAFGSIRMELTAGMLGQFSAVAACVAMDAGDIALQDVDYSVVRSAALASGDATPLVLTQVN